MKNRIKRKKTAYHEAGHAVITWYYDRPIFGASIAPDGDITGVLKRTSPFGRLPKMPVHEIEKELDIIMAGAVAEEQLTGKKITALKWGGNDYIDAVKIAIQWSEKNGKVLDKDYLVDISIDVDGITGCLFSGAFLDEFAGNVRELMTRPHMWECVEGVAQALLNKIGLSGEEVINIISKTWEKMDGDNQEMLIEKQRSNYIERPWGEWGPE
jgi:hypothetical protein